MVRKRGGLVYRPYTLPGNLADAATFCFRGESKSLPPRFEGPAPPKTPAFELARCHRLGWRAAAYTVREEEGLDRAVTSECSTEGVGPWCIRSTPRGSLSLEPCSIGAEKLLGSKRTSPLDPPHLWGLFLASPSLQSLREGSC